MEAHHTLICVPLNGIQVKTSLVIDSPSVSSRRGYSGCGIIDTKTIYFVFLSILPRWRVFFLGSPALHNAGTDRLQMVGVRSLHVDRSWLLVSSSSGSCQQFYLQHFLKYVVTGTESYAAHCLFMYIFFSTLKNVNKKDFIVVLFCIVLWSSASSKEEAGRRKKNKELGEPYKDSQVKLFIK